MDHWFSTEEVHKHAKSWMTATRNSTSFLQQVWVRTDSFFAKDADIIKLFSLSLTLFLCGIQAFIEVWIVDYVPEYREEQYTKTIAF